MRVGIFTYQRGHLKTWQILKKLLTKSFDITLFAFPFIDRPSRKTIFEDRPYQLIDLDIREYCTDHGIRSRNWLYLSGKTQAAGVVYYLSGQGSIAAMDQDPEIESRESRVESRESAGLSTLRSRISDQSDGDPR